MLPVIKRDKLKQSTQVLEESPPGGGRTSDGAVSIIQPFKRGMGEEGQQAEGGQKIGQMLLAVGKVMVEMIAVVLEDIIVFIFDFPTGTTSGDGLHDIVFVNGVRCGPRITAYKLLFAIGDGDFAPVHQQGIVAIAERYLVNIAVAFSQALLAVPTAFLKYLDFAGAGKIFHPFVQQGMGIGFTDKEEVHLLLPDRLTKRLVAIQVIAQQGNAPGCVMAAPGSQPTLCRRQLAILFLLAILCANKLRRQWHHAALPGRDDDRRNHRVTI